MGRLVGWMVGWLVGRSVGRSVGLLVGWLVRWSVVWLVRRCVGCLLGWCVDSWVVGVAGVGGLLRFLVGAWRASRLVGWSLPSLVRSLGRSLWSWVIVLRPSLGSARVCFAGSLALVGRRVVVLSCRLARSSDGMPAPLLVGVCPARSQGCSCARLVAKARVAVPSHGVLTL